MLRFEQGPPVRAVRRFARVVRELASDRDVRGVLWPSAGPRRFGSESLRFRGKVFALLYYRRTLVVKLPRSRVEELEAAGVGARWNPARRGPFREWLELDPASTHDWTDLAREALDFAQSLHATNRPVRGRRRTSRL